MADDLDHLDDLPKRGADRVTEEKTEAVFQSCFTASGRFILQRPDRKHYGTDCEIEVVDQDLATNVRAPRFFVDFGCSEQVWRPEGRITPSTDSARGGVPRCAACNRDNSALAALLSRPGGHAGQVRAIFRGARQGRLFDGREAGRWLPRIVTEPTSSNLKAIQGCDTNQRTAPFLSHPGIFIESHSDGVSGRFWHFGTAAMLAMAAATTGSRAARRRDGAFRRPEVPLRCRRAFAAQDDASPMGVAGLSSIGPGATVTDRPSAGP